jgi:amino acid adenylation domain-containing protein
MNVRVEGSRTSRSVTAQQRRLLRFGAGSERSPFVTTLKLRVAGASPGAALEALRDVVLSADVLRLRLSAHPVLDGIEVSLSQPRLESLEPTLGLEERADWSVSVSPVDENGFELQFTVPAYCADTHSMLAVARDLSHRLAGSTTRESAPSFWEVTEWWADLLAADAAFTGLAYWRERSGELRSALLALAGMAISAPFRPATRSRDLPPATRRLVSELETGTADTERGAVMVAAWTTIVARRFGYSGPIGVGLSGRGEEELHGVIGPLARTAPLGLRYSPARSFAVSVRDASFGLFEVHAWQDYFCSAAEEDAEGFGHEPLFAPFAYERSPGLPTFGGASPRIEIVDVGSVADRFLLRLRESEESISVDFDASRISPQLADAVLEGLLELLEAAALAPQTSCGALPVASAAELERASRASRFSDASSGTPSAIALFERVVGSAPDRVAVQAEGRSVTYAALDRIAGDLAARLARLGAGPEQLVALQLGVSLDLVVGVLAALKIEAPFIPIDPFLPVARRMALLSQFEPCVVVNAAAEAASATVPCTQCLAIEPSARAGDRRWESRRGDPDVLAYAMFTSGSTGVPKRVAIPSRALNSQIDWFVRTFELGADDRVLVRTLPSFDAFIWEVIAPVCAGATAVLTDGATPFDLDALLRSLRLGEVSRFQVTPDLLGRLVREAPAGVSPRTIFCGGEVLEARLGQSARALFGADVVNLYGPCETCVQVTSWCGDPGAFRGPVPVGRAMANVGLAIVDESGQICPFGVGGELTISGAALARGYLSDPRATAESFVPDAFGTALGGRAYRSGDLAEQIEDGEILVRGRLDSQTKIRGARVELAEVRGELMGVPGVRDCAVVVSGSSEKSLVAILEADTASPAGMEARIIEHASTRLPPWMVPSRVLLTTALPRLPSGKIDSQSLKSLVSGLTTAEAPRTPSEQRLAAIWRELLGVASVSRHDSFFDLGGQSLLLMRMAARIRETFGVDAPLMDIYRAKTLLELAKLIESLETDQRRALP